MTVMELLARQQIGSALAADLKHLVDRILDDGEDTKRLSFSEQDLDNLMIIRQLLMDVESVAQRP